MDSLFHYLENHRILREFFRYLAITIGSLVFAIGFQFFMFPNSIVSGGMSGIAMIINRLTNIPVGVTTIVLNIPLFIMAWKYFGLSFLIGSVAGMALSSVFVDVFAMTDFVATDDMLLACIMGGAIKGAGTGIIYYMGASTGGIDIVAKTIRRKYPHFNMGTLVVWLDVAIILAYALIFRIYESAMYSVVAMFVVGKFIDLVLYGSNSSAVCYIISDSKDSIVDEITSGHLHRGVTILNGEGAYSHSEKKVIMCVVKHAQVTEIRRIVRRIDEHAFVIVTEAKNVFGKGFENIVEGN